MWPIKILRFTVLVQVLLLVLSLGCANGIPPSHTRTSRQIIPLAQGTFNNILQSMSEGAKAVRLVVSRPFQQLRNSIPRFPFGGGATTSRPKQQSRPQKQQLDLTEVHYHYDDFGNRIENPKEYLKQFKNSISHSHSHIGDASALPDNIIKQLELKEELKFDKDVDSGNAFSSYDFAQLNMKPFKSNFQNNHFNSFGGFESSSTTHHTDDWTPLSKPKPASTLHTHVPGMGDNFGSSTKLFNKNINNYRSVKHYDSDRPSSSYSFHHFASPNVDYGVDTKEKGSSSFSSLLGSSSNKVSKTQNFDHFYDYYDNKRGKDYQGSESQIQAMAEKSVMQMEKAPQAAALVQKMPATTAAAPTTTTTTQRPTTTTRSRPTTPRSSSRAQAKHQEREHKTNGNTERPNYPEYFFNPKPAETQKPKFIPTRNVRDEEDLFKGALTPPGKFMPQLPKYPNKEPVHIVMAQPVHDKASIKAKDKFRKQVEGDTKKGNGYSLRKRYPTTRMPFKHDTTTIGVPSPKPTQVQVAATEGYAQNEVIESDRKYPKKYLTVETTTAAVRVTQRPTSPFSRGAVRARGSVKFGARL